MGRPRKPLAIRALEGNPGRRPMPPPPPGRMLRPARGLSPAARRWFMRLARLLREVNLQPTDTVGLEMMASLLVAYYEQIGQGMIDEAIRLSREFRQWARLYWMTPSDMATLLTLTRSAETDIEIDLRAPE